MKNCYKCNISKPLTEFYQDKTKNGGYRNTCKICDLKRAEDYRNKNKEKVSLSKKSSYVKKIDQYLLKCKTYRESNKNNINNRNKERRLNDVLYRLTINLRNLIGNSLRNKNYSKKSKTNEILGCSYEEFKIYLESRFESWMNWNNRGLYDGNLNFGWDIDHIIPLSSATCEDDIIRLNHYTNLQPLCSKVNRDIKINN